MLHSFAADDPKSQALLHASGSADTSVNIEAGGPNAAGSKSKPRLESLDLLRGIHLRHASTLPAYPQTHLTCFAAVQGTSWS
jgi:hypothetical protein